MAYPPPVPAQSQEVGDVSDETPVNDAADVDEADLSLDEPLPPPMHPQPREPVQPPFAYDLHPGDTMYMDGRPFIVDEVRFYDVAFRDPTMTYPIFRAESKTILEGLLDRDERNWPYRTTPLPGME